MRFLKWTILSLLALALLVTGALALLWVKPEILLNETRLRQALRWAPPELKASWTKLDWRFFARPGWSKRTTLAFDELCVSYQGVFDSCVHSLRLDLTFTLKDLRPRITEIQQLEIDITHLTLAASTETPTATGPLPDLRAPDFTEHFPPYLDLSLLGRVRIGLNQLTVESREGPPLTGRLRLEQKDPQGTGTAFRLEGEMRQEKMRLTLATDVVVLPAPALVASGQLGADTGSAELKSSVQLHWGKTLRLQAKPRVRFQGHPYQTDVQLQWSQRAIDLAFGPVDFARRWRQLRFGLGRCSLKSSLDNAQGYPRETSFQCPFFAEAKPRLPQMPRQHGTLLATVALRPRGQQNVEATFSLREASEDPFIESRIEADGKFELHGDKIIGDPELKFSAMLRMPEVQVWKKAMERTPVAVPAPFHVLSGPIELNLSLDRWSRERAEVNLKLDTNLRSATQAVVTSTEGSVDITNPLSEKRRIHLEARALLKDLRLEAPPLRLAEPPQFLPDSRFVNTEAEAQAAAAPSTTPSSFSWNLKLETEKPAHIQSNLLKAAVPVAVNLNLGSVAPTTGYVEVQKMPLQFFRDLAEVQKIRVSFSPGSESGQLNGLITRSNQEVQIRILVLGSTEAPRIEFESDPPLTRSQILSVLLFNKSLNELTEEEASSTQNVGQALSDRALGLFSLVFLSSTPIQSVGYDPVTQTYSARVRLDNKTTLSVSSNFPQGQGDRQDGEDRQGQDAEKREFTLRRRLKGSWAIRTELRQEENRPDVVVTLLEWFKRF